ncbi:MAG: hypothetical protein QM770_20615 [Tepidisphaeraceae bacterium]
MAVGAVRGSATLRQQVLRVLRQARAGHHRVEIVAILGVLADEAVERIGGVANRGGGFVGQALGLRGHDHALERTQRRRMLRAGCLVVAAHDLEHLPADRVAHAKLPLQLRRRERRTQLGQHPTQRLAQPSQMLGELLPELIHPNRLTRSSCHQRHVILRRFVTRQEAEG